MLVALLGFFLAPGARELKSSAQMWSQFWVEGKNYIPQLAATPLQIYLWMWSSCAASVETL